MNHIEDKLKALRKEYPTASQRRKTGILLAARMLKLGQKSKPHYSEFRKYRKIGRSERVMNALA